MDEYIGFYVDNPGCGFHGWSWGDGRGDGINANGRGSGWGDGDDGDGRGRGFGGLELKGSCRHVNEFREDL